MLDTIIDRLVPFLTLVATRCAGLNEWFPDKAFNCMRQNYSRPCLFVCRFSLPLITLAKVDSWSAIGEYGEASFSDIQANIITPTRTLFSATFTAFECIWRMG